jgi:hypothetical protein
MSAITRRAIFCPLPCSLEVIRTLNYPLKCRMAAWPSTLISEPPFGPDAQIPNRPRWGCVLITRCRSDGEKGPETFRTKAVPIATHFQCSMAQNAIFLVRPANRLLSEQIDIVYRSVLNHTVKVIAAPLRQWVSTEPPARARAVDPVFVEHKIGGGLGSLGREAEGVKRGGWASDADRFSEGAVFVTGGH